MVRDPSLDGMAPAVPKSTMPYVRAIDANSPSKNIP
jgi:hypothetical protein